jgi:hypothetical protein
MTVGTLFVVTGLILMVLGSCGIPAGRVSLWNLGWPFFLAGVCLFGGVALLR